MTYYYDILGVDKTATEEQIKNAHKALYVKNHPDRFKGAQKEKAEKKCKQLNEAFAILGDKTKRAQYDAQQSGSYGGFNFGGDQYSGFSQGFNNFRFEDLFTDFGGANPNTTTVPYELDVSIMYRIKLRDVYYGSTAEVKYEINCTCTRCKGSGIITNKTRYCSVCHGRGYVSSLFNFTCSNCRGTGYAHKACSCRNGYELRVVTQKITIPLKADLSKPIIYNGAGNEWQGHKGVLRIKLELVEKGSVSIDAMGNLHQKCYVTLQQILKRAKINVKIFDDSYTITIPTTFTSDTKLILNKKGLTHNGVVKDLYIQLVVNYPVH